MNFANEHKLLMTLEIMMQFKTQIKGIIKGLEENNEIVLVPCKQM